LITLYGTGPMWGLPHASPFAIKAEVLLKLSGLPYEQARADMRKAPRGKMPWIVDGGEVISDSRLIKVHLEVRHGVDFSGDYSPRALGHGLAIERMLEDHLYFFMIESRWLEADNFDAGPSQFFYGIPTLVRPLIIRMALKKTRSMVNLQGTGRLTPEEKLSLVRRAIDGLEAAISGQNYMLGGRVCGVDATAFGFLASLAAPLFRSGYGEYLRSKPELGGYLTRMQAEFFPELPPLFTPRV
jgi:glutathione S-transferase